MSKNKLQVITEGAFHRCRAVHTLLLQYSAVNQIEIGALKPFHLYPIIIKQCLLPKTNTFASNIFDGKSKRHQTLPLVFIYCRMDKSLMIVNILKRLRSIDLVAS